MNKDNLKVSIVLSMWIKPIGLKHIHIYIEIDYSSQIGSSYLSRSEIGRGVATSFAQKLPRWEPNEMAALKLKKTLLLYTENNKHLVAPPLAVCWIKQTIFSSNHPSKGFTGKDKNYGSCGPPARHRKTTKSCCPEKNAKSKHVTVLPKHFSSIYGFVPGVMIHIWTCSNCLFFGKVGSILTFSVVTGESDVAVRVMQFYPNCSDSFEPKETAVAVVMM